MIKRLSVAILGTVALIATSVPAATAADPEIPRNWYGPQDWVASDGANDLLVGSPTGERFLHYGASAAPCVYPPLWSTTDEFFAYSRNTALARASSNYGLYSFGLKGAR